MTRLSSAASAPSARSPHVFEPYLCLSVSLSTGFSLILTVQGNGRAANPRTSAYVSGLSARLSHRFAIEPLFRRRGMDPVAPPPEGIGGGADAGGLLRLGCASAAAAILSLPAADAAAEPGSGGSELDWGRVAGRGRRMPLTSSGMLAGRRLVVVDGEIANRARYLSLDAASGTVEVLTALPPTVSLSAVSARLDARHYAASATPRVDVSGGTEVPSEPAASFYGAGAGDGGVFMRLAASASILAEQYTLQALLLRAQAESLLQQQAWADAYMGLGAPLRRSYHMERTAEQLEHQLQLLLFRQQLLQGQPSV
jgi:hypothetical protein